VESRLVTLTKVYLECHVFMWRMWFKNPLKRNSNFFTHHIS
jgi:hypothetical protein